MDAKTKTKMVNTLMSRFIQLYEDKYGRKPKFNRNTEKWGFGYLVDDLGRDSYATLEYYFTLRRYHTSQDFLRSYEDLAEWMREDAEDEAVRRDLLQETKRRVEEYRKQWHQKPST